MSWANYMRVLNFAEAKQAERELHINSVLDRGIYALLIITLIVYGATR